MSLGSAGLKSSYECYRTSEVAEDLVVMKDGNISLGQWPKALVEEIFRIPMVLFAKSSWELLMESSVETSETLVAWSRAVEIFEDQEAKKWTWGYKIYILSNWNYNQLETRNKFAIFKYLNRRSNTLYHPKRHNIETNPLTVGERQQLPSSKTAHKPTLSNYRIQHSHTPLAILFQIYIGSTYRASEIKEKNGGKISIQITVNGAM